MLCLTFKGFVPKNQFQLGKTYRETCIKSIAELEAEKSGKPLDQCQSSQMAITAKPTNEALKPVSEYASPLSILFIYNSGR